MSLVTNTGWMDFQSFTFQAFGSGTLYNYAGARYKDADYCYGVSAGGIDNCGRLICTNPVIPNNFFKGNTIKGIQVSVLRKSVTVSNSQFLNQSDSFASLVKNNVIQGADYQQDVAYPEVDTYAYYGSSSDTWLLSLLDSDINSGFGFVLNPKAYYLGNTIPVVDNRCYINHIQVKVYYEPHGMFMAM